ncbi:MAG: hypothetical protein M9894_15010 [Planctomycetes bacterium]|nr:hypothetical protein [Planctomycetota bacterium]
MRRTWRRRTCSWVALGVVVALLAHDRTSRAQDGGDEPQPPAERPEGGEPPAGDPPAAGRTLDTTSPVALALRELLRVDPRYATDGTVELVYPFDEDPELLDWTHQGFDRVDLRGGRLTLGVGSNGQGLLQHRLELAGRYEVTLRCRLEWVSSRSDLVFVLGKGGGGRFGNQLVERQARGWKPVTRVEPARDRFAGAREVTVRYVVDGDDVTVWLNGVQMGSTDKLKRKLDGKVGLWCTDMRLVLDEVRITGRPDTSRL